MMSGLDERITGIEDALVSLGALEFGDLLGHLFHGNQHTGGLGSSNTARQIARERVADLKSVGAISSYVKGAEDAAKVYEPGTPGISAHALAAEAYAAAERATANGPGPVEDHNYHYGRADVHATVAVNPTASASDEFRPSPTDRNALARALATEQTGLLDPGRAWSARVAQAEAAVVALGLQQLDPAA